MLTTPIARLRLPQPVCPGGVVWLIDQERWKGKGRERESFFQQVFCLIVIAKAAALFCHYLSLSLNQLATLQHTVSAWWSLLGVSVTGFGHTVVFAALQKGRGRISRRYLMNTPAPGGEQDGPGLRLRRRRCPWRHLRTRCAPMLQLLLLLGLLVMCGAATGPLVVLVTVLVVRLPRPSSTSICTDREGEGVPRLRVPSLPATVCAGCSSDSSTRCTSSKHTFPVPGRAG